MTELEEATMKRAAASGDVARASPAMGFPWRATATVVVATLCLMIFGIVVEKTTADRSAETDRQRDLLVRSAAEMVRLGDMLTTSALLYAATGAVEWESRYLTQVPVSRATIGRVLAVLPDDLRWDVETTTKEASLRLEEFGAAALRLVRFGEQKAALDLLNGTEYAFWKQVYADGITVLSKYLDRLATARGLDLLRFNLVRTSVNGVIAAAVLLSWLLLLVRITAWQRALREHQRALTRTVDTLNASNAALEQEKLILHRYRQALDGSPEAVALVGTDETFLVANPTMARLVNSTPEHLAGRSVPETFGTDHNRLIDVHSQFRQCLTGREVIYEAWWTFPSTTGERYVEVRLAPLRRLSGETEGALVVIRDLTDRKRQETQLAQATAAAVEASRVKSEFLATMSHEFRTPLNGILGMASLLTEADLTDAERSYLEAITDSGRTLFSLISSILDFAQAEAGGLEPHPIEFRPERSVARVVAMLAPKAAEKGIDLSAALADDVPAMVVADERRIRQVLFNLVWNGIKFSDAGSVAIEVTVADRGAGRAILRYDVIDTGIGIKPDDQSKLFRDFVQIDGGSTRRHDGAGLGLAVCRRLVHLMGGNIGVESEFGQGSCFWFTIPVADVVVATLPSSMISALPPAEPPVFQEAADQLRELSLACGRAAAAGDGSGAVEKAEAIRSLASAFGLVHLAEVARDMADICRQHARDPSRVNAGITRLDEETAAAVPLLGDRATAEDASRAYG